MKKLFSLILAFELIISSSVVAVADQQYFNLKYGDSFDLEPGIYEVGKDFQAGKYDIRFNGLDEYITVSFSVELNENRLPDLTNEHSFSFTFNSGSNWWNIGGFVVTLFPGYFLIENSPCRMWVEK